MNCKNECQNLVFKLEHLNKYKQELENKLNHYEKVVIEKDIMQDKTCIGLNLLDSIKNKQSSMFNALISRHNELCNKYLSIEEQLNKLYEENIQSQFKKEQLNNKLNDLEANLKDLNISCSTLRENTQKLQKQLSDLFETTHNLRIMHQKMELELKDKDQKIICIQNIIEEKVAQINELEKKILVEQVKYTNLLSSKSYIEIENEKIIKSLKREFATIKDDMNEKSIEFVNIKQCFNDKEQEHKIGNCELNKLKRNINDLQELYEKEKCYANEEMSCLNAEVLSLNTELDLYSTKMCEAQTENSIFKFKLEDQCKTTKGLMLTEEHLRQKVKHNKQTIELITQKLLAERKLRVNESKLCDRKSLLKIQEKCELQQLIEDQARQIKRLMIEMAELKPSTVRHNSKETFTSVLNTYLEFLCDDDQIAVFNDINVTN